jgi:hypothetical protein
VLDQLAQQAFGFLVDPRYRTGIGFELDLKGLAEIVTLDLTRGIGEAIGKTDKFLRTLAH